MCLSAKRHIPLDDDVSVSMVSLKQLSNSETDWRRAQRVCLSAKRHRPLDDDVSVSMVSPEAAD